MSTSRNLDTPAVITPADIYFVVFRHKWKIIVLTLLGLAAAAGFYFSRQTLYQSEAELFIRYVTDNRLGNPLDNNSRAASLIDPAQSGANIMNSEMQILSSLDLAAEVATNFGAEKILAKYGGGKDLGDAAALVRGNLKVVAVRDSADIIVTLHHADPDLVRPILGELLKDYREMHEKIHRPIGLSDETLGDQTDELSRQISQTEEALRNAKTNAGVISIADAEKSYEEELSRIRRELFQARESLAEHQTSLSETAIEEKSKGGMTNAAVSVPAETLQRYKSICQELDYFERRANEYIQSGYTPQNKLVQEVRQQSADLAKAKIELENKYPPLVDLDATGSSGTNALTASSAGASDSALVVSLPRRIKELQAQFDEIQVEAAKLGDAESRIADLERTKAVQEGNYNIFKTMLEQAHIDEALGPGRANNIAVIQEPSPPRKDFTNSKTTCLLALSGLLLGLAWACLIEFYLDRSVKRPTDVTTKLHMPFFLSIPDLNQYAHPRLRGPERRQLTFSGNGNGETGSAVANGALEVAAPTVNHALHSHCDALRDRLVNYFESINLTRKPKLVAITSTNKGSGVSTISAGLAASLSETGDGRVLLVDMNLENGAACQFVRGQPDCQLDDALSSDKRDQALVQDNLYVVSEGSNADKLPRILPKRFASLIPKLKASDYDYIIFDMPPVTQTSVTVRLAGFMDTVMLVIESEKTDRDVVQQANQLLLQSKAHVTAVLNKTRKYIPASLQHEINDDM